MHPKLPIVILFLLFLGLSNISRSQNVNIPSEIFKALLVGNPLINTNGDGEIQETEAMAFTGMIDVHNQLIYDLTGIEAFRNLKVLNCSHCYLNYLNLSANSALTVLICSENFIQSLDVSTNNALEDLYCDINGLTSLDLSANKSLKGLYCSYNELTSLTISDIPTLTGLNCSNNHLTNLDLSGDVSLILLDCTYNQLTSLDISANPALAYLYCDNNQLISLNGKNGKHPYLSTRNNPHLTCIQVDDKAFYELQHPFNIDTWTSYSEICTVGIDNILKREIHIFPNPSNGIFTISGLPINKALCIEIYNLLGENVYSGNNISNIDISFCPQGMYLVKVSDGKNIQTNKIEIR